MSTKKSLKPEISHKKIPNPEFNRRKKEDNAKKILETKILQTKNSRARNLQRNNYRAADWERTMPNSICLKRFKKKKFSSATKLAVALQPSCETRRTPSIFHIKNFNYKITNHDYYCCYFDKRTGINNDWKYKPMINYQANYVESMVSTYSKIFYYLLKFATSFSGLWDLFINSDGFLPPL